MHLDLFTQERKELLQKMESLQSQNTALERTISTLENEKSTLNKEIE